MTTPTLIEFVSKPERVQVSYDEGRWQVLEGPTFGTDMEAAQFVQEALNLAQAMPHDSRNIMVESAEGFGAITSKGYPPDTWGYAHGKRLLPEASAATTLANPESLESLQTTLAGVLVRTRLLTSERAKPTIDHLPRLPDSLSVAASTPSDTFLRMLETELANRLNAAASPCETFEALVKQLNSMGHQFSMFDEDGGEWQTWLSPKLVLSAGYPDLHEIRSGELPEWDLDERCFCDVAWVTASASEAPPTDPSS